MCQDLLGCFVLSCEPVGAGLCAGRGVWGHRGGQGAEELAGDVSLEAASDLTLGLAFSATAGHVGLGGGVAAHSGARDGVEGFVQRPVSPAIKPVAGGLTAGCLKGAGAGECGERGVVATASGG